MFGLFKGKRSKRKEAVRDFVSSERGFTFEEEIEHQRRSENSDYKHYFEESEQLWNDLSKLSSDEMSVLMGGPIRKRSAQPQLILLAASILLALGLSVFYLQKPSAETTLVFANSFQTDAPWTKRLPDGSIMRMNENTEVHVSFDENLRSIDLVRGEAVFTVMHEAIRPFDVVARGVNIRAVGTEFNVKINESGLSLLVTEGTVSVTRNNPSTLNVSQDLDPGSVAPVIEEVNFVSQGERAEINLSPNLPEGLNNSINVDIAGTNNDEIQDFLSWRSDLLVLGGGTLADIASEFEQKTGAILFIESQELNDLRIGGRFPSNDIHAFLQLLESSFNISWELREDGVYVIGSK